LRKAPLFLGVMALLLILAAGQCLLPSREMSEMENRVLAGAPKISLLNFWNGTLSEQTESFAADQLPFRDGFVSVYSAMQAALGRKTMGDAILGEDGRLFDRSEMWSQRNVRLNAQALESLAQRTGKKALLLAVPSAAAVYPEKMPAHAPLADEKSLLAVAAGETEVLSLLDAFGMAAPGEDLYYRTDHHWTAAGARLGYEIACEALGIIPTPSKPAVSIRGFYGSFYARYPLPWIEADTFSYVPYEGIRLLVDGVEKEGLVDRQVLLSRDKYAALLYGNHGYIELIHDDAPAGTLLVIKDSYANAILPALAMHYSRIIAVDPRYFSGNIVDVAMQYEGDEILCIYGLNTLASGRTIALLEGL